MQGNHSIALGQTQDTEAERGEFASESEVKRVAKKWTRRAH